MTEAYLIANGDLRLAANQNAWPTQKRIEGLVADAFKHCGVTLDRAHPYDPNKGHGFIDSQKYGIEIFRSLEETRPIVVVLTTWQYSHHVLAGLVSHKGPILTVANFSGTWPGLVGLLNLNASLTKSGQRYSTCWSVSFDDAQFKSWINEWVNTKKIAHDEGHVARCDRVALDDEALGMGKRLGEQLRKDKAIIGVFDEGCMGMFNAIIPDHLLNDTGIFKERLSQSTLYYETQRVAESEAREAFRWLQDRGMQFHFGPDEETDLTEQQVLKQLKMYIAAMRLADEFGCDAIGIQYQQGLKDLLPASDLAEGLLNNSDRPPVKGSAGEVLLSGRPLPHFNEVDECAAVDALVTNRVWTALGLPPETTLHDVRWGEEFEDEFVWVFEISGAAPPAHFDGGYAGASSMRQPPMYFRLGGGTLRGVCKPGHIVWSRVYIEAGRLAADVGTGRVVSLPETESDRRWHATNYEWPIMHAVLSGVSRDQLMARHKSNHIQVAYATDADSAFRAMSAKIGMFQGLGIECFVCDSSIASRIQK